MANLTRYDLVKGKEGWDLKTGGRIIRTFASKGEAIDDGGLEKAIGGEGTVRIHTLVGGIEEERTYPRSRDPRKWPG
jgi:hypothetical protein